MEVERESKKNGGQQFRRRDRSDRQKLSWRSLFLVGAFPKADSRLLTIAPRAIQALRISHPRSPSPTSPSVLSYKSVEKVNKWLHTRVWPSGVRLKR